MELAEFAKLFGSEIDEQHLRIMEQVLKRVKAIDAPLKLTIPRIEPSFEPEPYRSRVYTDLMYGQKVVGPEAGYLINDIIIDDMAEMDERMFGKFLRKENKNTLNLKQFLKRTKLWKKTNIIIMN